MKIEVIGVHKLNPDDYEFMNSDSWFIIELIVTEVSGFFEFLFVQPDPAAKPGWDQVCYRPVLLNGEGTHAVRISEEHGALTLDSRPDRYPKGFPVWRGNMRCAFFLFDYRANLPVEGPTGQLVMPPISLLPDRLRHVTSDVFFDPD